MVNWHIDVYALVQPFTGVKPDFHVERVTCPKGEKGFNHEKNDEESKILDFVFKQRVQTLKLFSFLALLNFFGCV